MTVRRTPSALALLALVGVNLVPLVGVLYFGWSLFGVLLLYWLESGIIGLFNVPRILLARGATLPERWRGSNAPPPEPNTLGKRLGYAGFFLVHYGGFWLGHFLLLVMLGSDLFPAENATPADPYSFPLTVALLFMSHGLSFGLNYLGRGEYRVAVPGWQMWRPYGRVFTFHLATLGGGMLAARWGSPMWALVLLVTLKTLIDAGTHLVAHALRPDGATGAPVQ